MNEIEKIVFDYVLTLHNRKITELKFVQGQILGFFVNIKNITYSIVLKQMNTNLKFNINDKLEKFKDELIKYQRSRKNPAN